MAETINMPKLGFDMAEGLLVRWVKQVGENINKGDVLAEIETDKATVEVESSASGVVLQLIVDQGTMVPVNAPIAVVGVAGEKVDSPSKVEGQKSVDGKPAAQSAPTVAPVTQASSPVDSGSVKASPLAKKIARDQKVDLSRVQGTGPGGRIVRRDIESVISHQLSPKGTLSVTSVPSTQPNYQLPIPTIKLFPLQSCVRPLAADWLNPRQPSRTST